jgi:hypothetical protein
MSFMVTFVYFIFSADGHDLEPRRDGFCECAYASAARYEEMILACDAYLDTFGSGTWLTSTGSSLIVTGEVMGALSVLFFGFMAIHDLSMLFGHSKRFWFSRFHEMLSAMFSGRLALWVDQAVNNAVKLRSPYLRLVLLPFFLIFFALGIIESLARGFLIPREWCLPMICYTGIILTVSAINVVTDLYFTQNVNFSGLETFPFYDCHCGCEGVPGTKLAESLSLLMLSMEVIIVSTVVKIVWRSGKGLISTAIYIPFEVAASLNPENPATMKSKNWIALIDSEDWRQLVKNESWLMKDNPVQL